LSGSVPAEVATCDLLELAYMTVSEAHMTQTNNRFLDEMAKLMTDAAGAAQGLRRDFETMMRSQGERMLREMDVVQREEFEAVKEMAAKAREENEQLAARVAALEAEVAALKGRA
jgi:BMFP domain-containing protein YqiC